MDCPNCGNRLQVDEGALCDICQDFKDALEMMDEAQEKNWNICLLFFPKRLINLTEEKIKPKRVASIE